ncbi:hypothetical protein EJ08DRAFT_475865 [Tothia fuscella]|uniref:Uncharacterized protein n=1 Tax=Tothia fuscella TaxID=1048955 RepID=A0A9P4NIJ9_9PEZI|nr:hypothetical protein EJ08DRAFT_475865 [Tothia fuscella]
MGNHSNFGVSNIKALPSAEYETMELCFNNMALKTQTSLPISSTLSASHTTNTSTSMAHFEDRITESNAMDLDKVYTPILQTPLTPSFIISTRQNESTSIFAIPNSQWVHRQTGRPMGPTRREQIQHRRDARTTRMDTTADHFASSSAISKGKSMAIDKIQQKASIPPVLLNNKRMRQAEKFLKRRHPYLVRRTARATKFAEKLVHCGVEPDNVLDQVDAMMEAIMEEEQQTDDLMAQFQSLSFGKET